MKAAYKTIGKPYIFHMEPDDAHDFMVSFCRSAAKIPPLMGLLHFMTKIQDSSLEKDLMGLHFTNPFGLSAGLDKTGELMTCLDAAGWGFETFGTMTGSYSKGNEKPWYHRLPEHTSLLIHAGLPSEGAEVVAQRASEQKRKHGMLLSGSVGQSNREYPDGIDGMIHDISHAFDIVMSSPSIEIAEVNISCPNLQMGEVFNDPSHVTDLFDELASHPVSKPVMVKMPSRPNASELSSILDVLAGYDFVKGVSVSNLRKERDGLDIPSDWQGNISGIPTRESSESAISFVKKNYDNRFVINGIGGTITPEDALRKLDLGADLVSGITTFMYRGPQTLAEWKRGYVKSSLRR